MHKHKKNNIRKVLHKKRSAKRQSTVNRYLKTLENKLDVAEDHMDDYLEIFCNACPLINRYFKAKYEQGNIEGTCPGGQCRFIPGKGVFMTGSALAEQCGATASSFLMLNEISPPKISPSPSAEMPKIHYYTHTSDNWLDYCGHVFVIVEHLDRYYLIQSFVYNYPARLQRISKKRAEEIHNFFYKLQGDVNITDDIRMKFVEYVGLDLVSYNGVYVQSLSNAKISYNVYPMSKNFIFNLCQELHEAYEGLHAILVNRSLITSEQFVKLSLITGEPINTIISETEPVLKRLVHEYRNALFYMLNKLAESFTEFRVLEDTPFRDINEVLSPNVFADAPEFIIHITQQNAMNLYNKIKNIPSIQIETIKIESFRLMLTMFDTVQMYTLKNDNRLGGVVGEYEVNLS